MRKVVSLLMALVMTLSVCSVTAWAEGDIDAAGANVAGVYNVSDDAVVSNYATLQAAIDAAGADQYVKLLGDVVSNTQINVKKTITLDLNGKTMQSRIADTSKFAFSVTGSGVLTIKDSGTEGVLDLGDDSIQVMFAEMKLESGTIKFDNKNAAAVAVIGASFSMTGGKIDLLGGSAVNFGYWDSEVEVNGGTINCNHGANWAFGESFVTNSTVTIDGDAVINSVSEKTGEGMLFAPVDGSVCAFVVKGGAFTDIASAVKYAAEKATIKLANDVTDNVVIPQGADVTIDLNGHKIVNKDGHTITVQMGAALTVNGTGTVDNVTHGKAAIYNNGVVTLNGGTYERSAEAGTDKDHSGGNSFYTILNHGFMVVNDGVVVKNKGHFSSLFENGYYNYKSGNEASGYVDGTNEEKPELALNGGIFDGGLNTIKNDDNATLTINGGTFKNYTQACVQNHHIASITNGTFTGEKVHAVLNCGAKNCGIVEGHDEHVMTISGGIFKGGIAKTFGTLAVTGGTFSDGNPLPYVDADNYAVTKNVNDEYVVSEKSHGDDGTTAADSVVVIEANASTTDKEMVSKTIDKSDIHTDMELVVKTASGDEKKQTSVTLNQAAVAAVGNGEDLTLTVKDVTAETKASDDKNSAAYGKGMSGKKADSALVVQVELKKGADKVFTTKTDNAYADVSVFYGKGLGAGTVHVYYLNGSSIQELTSVAALSGVDQFVYDGGTGVVTMRLAHFSEYLIATETTTSGGSSSGGGTASIPVTSGNGQNKKAGDVVSVTMQSGSKVAVVYVDGVALSAKDYVVSGSSVRVQGTYTAKLAQGTHVLHVVYNDGRTATATFTINGSTSPKTFDAGVAVYVGMALMSVAGGALVIGKKKEF